MSGKSTIPFTGMTKGPFAVERALYQHSVAWGVDGGDFTQDILVTRNLDLIFGSISGASITAAGLITWPAGEYMLNWYAVGHKCGTHVSHIIKESDGSRLILGSCARANSGTTDVVSLTVGNGFLNLSAATQIALKHTCDTTKANDGLGIASASNQWPTENEVYASLSVLRLGEAI